MVDFYYNIKWAVHRRLYCSQYRKGKIIFFSISQYLLAEEEWQYEALLLLVTGKIECSQQPPLI